MDPVTKPVIEPPKTPVPPVKAPSPLDQKASTEAAKPSPAEPKPKA